MCLVYFKSAFDSPRHKFWGPTMAYLYSWTSVLLLRPSGLSIVALSFATYSVVPLMTTLRICDPKLHQYTLTRIVAALCICKYAMRFFLVVFESVK